METKEQEKNLQSEPETAGVLFVCGTPIGNLEDASARLLRVLGEVDLIAAEDTRITRRLLERYEIKKRVVSYHEHNKNTRGPGLIQSMLEGKKVALVSDAGMPGISDPGEDLVKSAIRAGVKVVPIPGPTASITALAVSGLSTSRFRFEGFLPRKSSDLKRVLRELRYEQATLIFYESPRRLTSTIRDMIETLGDREAAVCRELTKIHEQTLRGRLSELLAHFQQGEVKGEIVLVVAGAGDEPAASGRFHAGQSPPRKTGGIEPESLVARLMEAGIQKKDAIRLTAEILGLSRKEVYSRCLELRARSKND